MLIFAAFRTETITLPGKMYFATFRKETIEKILIFKKNATFKR